VHPKVYVDNQGELTYELRRGETKIILPSKMGIVVDGIELGKGVALKSMPVETHRGSFEWLGTSSTVENNYVAANFEVTHLKSGRKWQLETRCYDTGFAFRYVVPGSGPHKVDGETTTWKLPADAQLWYRKNGGAFQTYWKKSKAAEIKNDFNAQLNVTIELSDGSYASLNESGGFSFSGTSLEFNGTSEASTLFAGNKDGWTIRGDVVTPWRIVMAAPDLNGLVNCNLTAAVCPAPDKTLFPNGCHTEWIQPGRSLWQWWGYWNPGTQWEKQRWFVDNAAALGCQYYLVDEGWEHPAQGWVTDTRTAWEALADLADYARGKGIKLLVWRSYPANVDAHYEGMETIGKRVRFYENCKKAGVFGAKIDFLNSEDVEHSTFMHDCLREAAKYGLVINYHGAPKPKGGERTYPNQVSREGVVGMEHNKWETIPRSHYATTPFTRFLAGYADFTITTFQPDFIKGTTSTLQLAQAITYTSPALHWADKPQYYLNSPAVDLVRSVPTTWDETIVLPSSKIGRQAAYARRKGLDWYVGIINGSDDKVTQELNLTFLGKGSFATTLFKDVPGKPVKLKKSLRTTVNGDVIKIRMSPGGGFVAVFRKLEATPYGGAIYGHQDVSLRFVKGADVHYTLDGSKPTAASPKYQGTFSVDKNCQLRAGIVGGDGKGTEISARFVTLDVPMPEEDGDSILRTGKMVELMNLTPGEIYYTLDGSAPTTKSILYTKPVALDTDTTINAITVVNGLSSPVFEKSYRKQPGVAQLPQVKLSDLRPIHSTVGWDRLRVNENMEGKPISIEGKEYASGILAHAPSVLEYKLDESFGRFVAGMGVEDSKKDASVVFKVLVGKKVLAESPVLSPGLTWYFDVEIPRGQQTIKLIAEDANDGKTNDHSVWVNAGFIRRNSNILKQGNVTD
jgi:alpha-glucosidase